MEHMHEGRGHSFARFTCGRLGEKQFIIFLKGKKKLSLLIVSFVDVKSGFWATLVRNLWVWTWLLQGVSLSAVESTQVVARRRVTVLHLKRMLSFLSCRAPGGRTLRIPKMVPESHSVQRLEKWVFFLSKLSTRGTLSLKTHTHTHVKQEMWGLLL